MIKDYSIIWKTFNANSVIGIHLGTTNVFSLPYFIDGKDKDLFENGKVNDLQEIHLLRGLLIGYSDNPPTMDIEYLKQFFSIIIEYLRIHFQFESTERLILDIASFIRRENGDYASFRALMTGVELLPDNSKIIYDLCVDLYNMLERTDFPDRIEGINILRTYSNRINVNNINPEFQTYLNQFKEYVDLHNSALINK